jgi:hypothetical protein
MNATEYATARNATVFASLEDRGRELVCLPPDEYLDMRFIFPDTSQYILNKP